MTKKMICIVCPRGCQLQLKIQENHTEVSGNQCSRGEAYALQEIREPMRILTTTVRTDSPVKPRIPVKLSKEIPLRQFPDYMDEVNQYILRKSCIPGDILIENILTDEVSGINLLATGAYDGKAVQKRKS